uniref:Galactoside-binding lectin n=1 Tax=Schistocephalus solidus TaxID=70667 RepID=A0A0X3PIU7_SCHSO
MEDDQEQGFYYQIPGGLLDKDVIEIHGRFLGDSDISVRLLAEDLSPELTRTLPFGFLLTSHGKWSVEVIDDKNKKHEQSGNVTLPEVQIFKIRIIAYSANYELYVNDTKLLTQPHMVPLTAVSHLAIDGEAEFTSVEFKDLNSEAESAQSEDTTSSRSSNSAMESRDKLPEITAQPGFVRLSESRRSYNRRPDDPVLIPLNSSIRRREADLQPYERYDEQAVRTTQVESSYAVPTLPSQSENATGGQVEASKAAKVRTVPAPAAKDKEKRRSSSRLLDKLHRRKSTDHVGHKGSHDQRMEASPSIWHAEGGVEMSVDSKEIYKGGKQSAVSEPNLTTATKAGKEAKHKSSKHSIFSKHSKDPKDGKKRSASSPPNVPALGVKSSKNESDKKKGHSSLMGSKLGSHKSKTSKTDKRKSVPTAASTEGTSNAHLARTQENNNEYAVTGGEEISAATTLRTSRTSTASTKNKHSMHFKPSQKGAYDLKSAKDRGSLDETGGLKGVASLPKTDNDTNMHHFPRSNLDELNSPIVNQQISDDTFVYAALPPADLDHWNSRTRSSHSSRSPDSKRGHKDILPASELGALGKRSSESSRNSSWSPHRGEQAKGAQLPYHSAQRASDNDRESWSPSSRSASESPNRTNKQDGAIGNLQPLMVTSTAEDVQHSMPPAENIADRAKQISGTSQGQTSLNQIDSSVVPSQRVSFDHYDSAGIKKSPTSLTHRGSSAAVAVGATTSAMQSKDKKSFENTKADKKDKKKSKDKKIQKRISSKRVWYWRETKKTS